MDKGIEYEYQTIDKNWTNHPFMYCKVKKGVLTARLLKLHRCDKRGCKGLVELKDIDFEEVE